MTRQFARTVTLQKFFKSPSPTSRSSGGFGTYADLRCLEEDDRMHTAPGDRPSESGLRTENGKPLALGDPSKVFIKGHELQTRRIVFSGQNGCGDLQRVRGPDRMRFDYPLRVSADNLHCSHFR